MNRLLLTCAAMKKGFQSQWWGTYRQWQQRGCRVRQRPHDVDPGHWGSKIIFYQNFTATVTNKEGDEEERSFPMLKEYCVFNSEQVNGAEAFHAQTDTEAAAIPDFEPAEKVIRAVPARIEYVAGDKACYYPPPLDYIQLPLKGQFEDVASVMTVTFHEIAHWTEHRLNWKGSYGMGELRAELTACFVATEVGVPSVNLEKDHAAYLQSWINTLSEDYRAIFKISSAANAAADFILSFSRKEEAVPA